MGINNKSFFKKFLLFLIIYLSSAPVFSKECETGENSNHQIITLVNIAGAADKILNSISSAQKLRMEKITTYFENSTTIFQYDYTEDIGDKQGLTAGRIGFISSEDMGTLVRMYCTSAITAAICAYQHILDKLQASNSSSTEELGPEFIKAWKKAALDPRFRFAQDRANDEWYLAPALKTAKKYGVNSILGKEILYDTNIQQGIAMGNQFAETATKQLNGKPPEVSEKHWLKTFLAIRRAEQLNPNDKPDAESAKVWADTVYRTDFLAKLLKEGNMELQGPIIIDTDPSAPKGIVN